MNTTTTFTTTTKPPSCEVPPGQGQCVDISNYCNFKTVETSDGNNADSKAKVVCRQHYRLNLEYPKDPYIYGKESTYAYCICKNGFCTWRFNKGNVQCTFCPKETLQARKGKKQKFVEWDTGIAIYFPIMIDIRLLFFRYCLLIEENISLILFRAKEGWHVALDFNAELGDADDTVNGLKLHIVDERETHRGRRDRNSFELL